MRLFVCIWDWRNSVLGMTLQSASDEEVPQQLVPHNAIIPSRASYTFCSRLLFSGPSARIAHVRAGSYCVQKDVFSFGLLSPSSVEERVEGSAEEASPLMMSSNSIAFPLRMNVSFDFAYSFLFSLKLRKYSTIPFDYCSHLILPASSSEPFI